MTDGFFEPVPDPEGATDPHSTLVPSPSAPSHLNIAPQLTIELPEEVMVAIQHQVQQSGRSPSDLIQEVLHIAFTTVVSPPAASDPSSTDSTVLSLQAEIAQLKTRLSQLEPLIPQVAALAGKLIAF